MSVAIATLGMFQTCCGSGISGGGAPPYKPYLEERSAPVILVKKVEVETINLNEAFSEKIKVTLLNDGG